MGSCNNHTMIAVTAMTGTDKDRTLAAQHSIALLDCTEDDDAVAEAWTRIKVDVDAICREGFLYVLRKSRYFDWFGGDLIRYCREFNIHAKDVLTVFCSDLKFTNATLGLYDGVVCICFRCSTETKRSSFTSLQLLLPLVHQHKRRAICRSNGSACVFNGEDRHHLPDKTHPGAPCGGGHAPPVSTHI